MISLCFLISSCRQTPKDKVTNEEQSTNAASPFHNTALLQQDSRVANYGSKKKRSCCVGAPSKFRQVARTAKKS